LSKKNFTITYKVISISVNYLDKFLIKQFMKILKNLKSFIYQFDQFGQPINLMINKDNSYHTVLGSFVSLGIIAFTLFSLNDLLQDLYN
jgi:hypothetical protein